MLNNIMIPMCYADVIFYTWKSIFIKTLKILLILTNSAMWTIRIRVNCRPLKIPQMMYLLPSMVGKFNDKIYFKKTCDFVLAKVDVR